MSVESEPQFSKLRSYLWPIKGHELRRFVPMFLMAFFIGFVYATLRNLKDGLIVTADGSGAEVIPFIKVWAILPMAIGATALFIRLSHRISLERLFYLITSVFLLFFALFIFVLYPLRDTIHPHALAELAQSHLPKGFSGCVAMCRYWSFTLFYGMSELWGAVVLNILFWGLANDITRVGQAKRFYSLLGMGYNLATVVSGQVGYLFSHRVFNSALPFGNDVDEQCMILLTSSVLVAGILLLLCFRWLTRHREYREIMEANDSSVMKKAEKLQARGSLRQDIRTLFKSRYVLSIAVIVLAYNLFINLVEVVWKDQVKQIYPDQASYTAYMSQVTFITGIIASFMAIFVSGNLLRRFGWTVTAMTTPIILLVTSIGFFGLLLCPHSIALTITGLLGSTPVAMSLFFGSMQNCLSRASKYTVFDASKELAYIPLSRDQRVRSKAAIDGVGSRMGKSGGSLIHQSLLMVLQNVGASIPFVAAFIVGILAVWMSTVRKLGRQFTGATEEGVAPPNSEAAPADPITTLTSAEVS